MCYSPFHSMYNKKEKNLEILGPRFPLYRKINMIQKRVENVGFTFYSPFSAI